MKKSKILLIQTILIFFAVATFLNIAYNLDNKTNQNGLNNIEYDLGTEEIIPNTASTEIEYVSDITWGFTISNDTCRTIAIDSSDNMYMGGYSDIQTDLIYNFTLVKYNKSGDQQWNSTCGGISNDYCYGIALDAQENIFMVGYTYSYGAGGADVLLAKFDKNGTFIWNITWGKSGNDLGYGVTIDPSNNIYVAGYTDSFGAGLKDLVVVKFDENGIEQWNATWGAGSDELAYGVALDDLNNVYAAGYTESYGAGQKDMCLVKYNENGNLQWYNTSGTGNHERAYGITVDNSNNIILTGYTSVDIFTNNGYIVKFSSNGVKLWTKTWTSGNSITYGVTTDLSNNVYISGKTGSMIEPDFLLLMYNSSGDLEYDGTWRSDPLDFAHYGYSISLNSEGRIYIGGDAYKTEGSWPYLLNHRFMLIEYRFSIDLNVISPVPDEYFSEESPMYTISVSGPNQNSTWYQLNDGPKYTFSGSTGEIDQAAWEACNDGSVKISFAVNDSMGDIIYENVTVIKDTTVPKITILTPAPFEQFGLSTFYASLYINESNLEDIWYNLNNGQNYPFSGNGSISLAAWSACENGTVNITFYTNDTVGHLASKEIKVYRDSTIPNITVISPLSVEWYNSTSPDFEVLIEDPKLNTTWYTVNNGPKFIFTGTTGNINQTAWDGCSNGTVSIKFYANNSIGNTVYENIILCKGVIYLKERTAYAIVIGIEDYQYITDLTYTEDDANEIYNYLRVGCNFKTSNMYLALGPQATKIGIDNRFALIRNKIQPDDIFFFYFSGHGGYEDGSHFMCPYDTVIGDPFTYYLDDDDLDYQLDQLNCDNIYVVIDACRSGGMIPESQSSGRYIMTACASYEDSIECPYLHNGVFSYFFLRSSNYATDSNGDGVIAMEEQYTYTSAETTSYASSQWSHSQHPTRYDGISGYSVLYPSIGSFSCTPNGNQLSYSFYLYGNGKLKTLNLTVCGLYPSITYQTINLSYFSPSNTGFGHYSGTIFFNRDITGGELVAEIEGYDTKIITRSFGDFDGDGFYDLFEIFDESGIDPRYNDTDFDGLDDYTEYYGVTDPILNDTDDDGLIDGLEVNTYFTLPLVNDTDDDGLEDGYEVYNSTSNPLEEDTDSDGLEDGVEVNTYGTSPILNDTDLDGMPDKWEIDNFLNPINGTDNSTDTDSDDLTNVLEYQYDTNPNDWDSDDDGWSDGDEVLVYGTDPLDPTSYPIIDDGGGLPPMDPAILIIIILAIISGVSIALTLVVKTKVSKKKGKADKYNIDKISQKLDVKKPSKRARTEIPKRKTITPKRPSMTYQQPRVQTPLRLDDNEKRIQIVRFLNNLPPPRSSDSIEGKKANIMAMSALRDISEGRIQEAFNSMILALRMGVPEPINSQIKQILKDSIPSASPIQQRAPTVGVKVDKFCTNCGAPRDPNGKFCTECGHQF